MRPRIAFQHCPQLGSRPEHMYRRVQTPQNRGGSLGVSMTNKRPRLFYGWLIVLVSAIGLLLGPPLMIFSFSVFFKPLVLDFHASRAAVSFAFSVFNTVGALLIPCIGMLIDRFGAKRVILV